VRPNTVCAWRQGHTAIVVSRGNDKPVLFVKVDKRDRLQLLLTRLYQRRECKQILLLHVDVAQLPVAVVLQIPKIPLSA
jgi:hypothetical protein